MVGLNYVALLFQQWVLNDHGKEYIFYIPQNFPIEAIKTKISLEK